MPSSAAGGHRPAAIVRDDDEVLLDDSDEETVEEGFDDEEEVDDDGKDEQRKSNDDSALSTSSANTNHSDGNHAAAALTPVRSLNGGAVAVAVQAAAGVHGGYATPRRKRQRTEAAGTARSMAAPASVEARRPLAALEDSRRLFQRLWTDDDEIVILQGFLDFTSRQGAAAHHHDTGPFYDQIRARLRLDFNKSQLVEKLRRLKKKYRNVITRMSSGRDYAFKSPHEQASFELSRRIWGNGLYSRGGGGGDDVVVTPQHHIGDVDRGGDVTMSDRPKPRRRNRKRPVADVAATAAAADLVPTAVAPVAVKVATAAADDPILTAEAPVEVKVATAAADDLVPTAEAPVEVKVATAAAEAPVPTAEAEAPVEVKVATAAAEDPVPTAEAPVEVKVAETHMPTTMASVPNVIEETVRSCLSPMFKELLCCAVGGRIGAVGGGLDGLRLSLLPLSVGSSQANAVQSAAGGDEKWRKQQILELEVFSKRMELLQEQIKMMLRELRS